ncbi:MAG: preprotein translocase subunit YajC [Thermoanaerobaculia bacterium]|nr:preprotein translocase subunit YajC [Thermoanaerobaculia bacterium]
MNTLAVIQSSGSSMLGTIVPMLIIVAIFFFIVIIPENRRRKRTEAMIAELKKGDRVILHSGIFGTVQSVESDSIQLRIAENVKIKIAKSAVAGLANDESGS